VCQHRDPIGLAGDVSTYGYAVANPNSYADPYGLYSLGGIFKCVAGGVGAYLFVDGVKASLQDFDALQQKRHDEGRCPHTQPESEFDKPIDPKYVHWQGMSEDFFSAFGGQGARFAALVTTGAAGLLGGFGETAPCSAIGFAIGAYKADGRATRAIETLMIQTARLLRETAGNMRVK
jgi:hypothetical protein